MWKWGIHHVSLLDNSTKTGQYSCTTKNVGEERPQLKQSVESKRAQDSNPQFTNLMIAVLHHAHRAREAVGIQPQLMK